MTELEKARALLLEAMHLLEYDQWPEPEQCQQLSALRERIVEFLGVEDEWAKSWDKMREAMAAAIREKDKNEL